ncbi:LPS translocon maturation chaperone LptM [Undibacterium sp. SXout7W]
MRTLISTITVVLLLSACGQKGPLTLPEKSPPPSSSMNK